MRYFLALFSLFLAVLCSQGSKPVYTQVTFMYDIKQGDLAEQATRNFQHDLSSFDALLAGGSNLIIFGGAKMKDYVWQRRKEQNTVFVLREIEEFKKTWYYPLAEKLRQKKLQDPGFPNKDYPQFALEYFNPIMLSKLDLLALAMQYDKFNSDYFIWTDDDLIQMAGSKIVSPQNHLRKVYQLMQPQWLFWTYNDPNMFLDLKKKYISRQANSSKAIIGSNFGGYVEAVRDVRCAFENLLRLVLQNGDLSTEEGVFSILAVKFPYLFPNTLEQIVIKEMYQRFHLYMNVDNKPEHSRFFRGRFDREGRISVVENRLVTKYKLANTTKFTQASVSKIKPLQGTKMKSPAKMDYSDIMVGSKGMFYRKIYSHEFLFLIVLSVFYIILLIKKPKNTLLRQQIPRSDAEALANQRD